MGAAGSGPVVDEPAVGAAAGWADETVGTVDVTVASVAALLVKWSGFLSQAPSSSEHAAAAALAAEAPSGAVSDAVQDHFGSNAAADDKGAVSVAPAVASCKDFLPDLGQSGA